ncbi:cytochrome b/b6 domain-containing protein [Mucilaginibacter achroorhodeus]|uniref:Cytochrome b/b6 domain-containing protein n=1 Tax=Mucilaginibacter achroorhodeus TaxID=2599294 RepID=A0A563TZZ3_9SPHI|nr:cytochrome b/b6 domain-containing protein [Mucilaginibacter achroorhodeus]TWR24946.1 cytochrome b/b6 domain-containing protein [Mucilaginibacter achroorhodeus]
MSIIEPVRAERNHPGEVKKHSAAIRFWHWGNTLIISGSLITVLINSTLTDRKGITTLVKNSLQGKVVIITDDQAGAISHNLEDKVWGIHIWFGYALAALFLFRILLEYFQLADQKFIPKLREAYKAYTNTKLKRERTLHELTVKIIYAGFYFVLFIMVITGLFLAFEDLLSPFKAIRHTVKEVHGFCMYLVLAFIVVHLVGVFLAERKDSSGIVSDMINGGKSLS